MFVKTLFIIKLLTQINIFTAMFSCSFMLLTYYQRLTGWYQVFMNKLLPISIQCMYEYIYRMHMVLEREDLVKLPALQKEALNGVLEL